MLYPQNGDSIVAIDSVTSLHPVCTAQLNMSLPFVSDVRDLII